MAALFSVSNFIVSQVNFHLLPFIDHQIKGSDAEKRCAVLYCPVCI